MFKRVAVLTDNYFLFKKFKKLISKKEYDDYNFTFYISQQNKEFNSSGIKVIDIKNEYQYFVNHFDLLLSLHFKQIFPAKLLENVKCINIHPGYNPYNRGWYPQVFSIINKLPFGATIHEVDYKIDAGKIICRKEIQIKNTDTSYSLYKKVLKLEMDLIKKNLKNILDQNYIVQEPENKGNINLSIDFTSLCQLDLNNINSLQNHLDLLRALTHDKYQNAYFYNDEGEKVFVKIEFSTKVDLQDE